MIELILLIVSVVLLYLLLPIVSLFMIIKYIFTGNRRMLFVWFFRTAREIDVFANVNGSEFFDAIFIREGGCKFGNPKETISSVIGKNYRDGTLSIAGMMLRNILDKIEKDHCTKSINNDSTNTKKNTH